MKFMVRVWDCNLDTDRPIRKMEYVTYEEAIYYVTHLPPNEGAIIDREESWSVGRIQFN